MTTADLITSLRAKVALREAGLTPEGAPLSDAARAVLSAEIDSTFALVMASVASMKFPAWPVTGEVRS